MTWKAKAVDKEVRVSTRNKVVIGVIREVTADRIVIDTKGGVATLLLGNVRFVHPINN